MVLGFRGLLACCEWRGVGFEFGLEVADFLLVFVFVGGVFMWRDDLCDAIRMFLGT